MARYYYEEALDLLSNPLVALAVAVVLIFLVWRKTKFMLTLLGVGLIVVGVIYLVFLISSTGVEQKRRMIDKPTIPGNAYRALKTISLPDSKNHDFGSVPDVSGNDR